MKQLFFIIFLFFILFVSTFAQNNNSSCPSIIVVGPKSVVQPDETMTFSALIGDEIKNYNVEYKWTVDKGTIINNGQGTPTVQISAEGLHDTVINATLEIKGLDENCNSKDSDAGVVAQLIEGQPYDTYEKLSINDELSRFDGYLVSVNENGSKAYGFVIIGIKEKEISNQTKKRLQRLIGNLDSRKFARERIVFAIDKSSYDRTVLWIVPPEAKLPKCDNCEILKASDIK